MPFDPQAAPYRPDPAIAAIAGWLGDPVDAADFPKTIVRFRNDRWARAVGLGDFDDHAWAQHFGRFAPLPDNLTQPLALRYHGHQFGVYNPDLGDGRGFLFAQMRDGAGRLLDLGTKGSGQTPWSRAGDGRLTLKGAVREILATEMLEALGVNTSKTFSVIETGESLHRGDEPSPTRSAVLVRLSHGHIRIGSFQRLAVLDEEANLRRLIDYALVTYPGADAPAGAPGGDQPPVKLLHQVVERLADMAASYMAAGFVHGVLNTDNMNISGESFDYGPWRFAPHWEPGFTAAYFDYQGRYAFGRQADAIYWNCAQLAVAFQNLVETDALVAALERFGPLYHAALGRRFAWRLGFASGGEALARAVQQAFAESALSPDEFFFANRGERALSGPLAELLRDATPLPSDHPYWADERPQSMLIEEVEALWVPIAEHDDWAPLHAKVAAIRRMGEAHGPTPLAQGHRTRHTAKLEQEA